MTATVAMERQQAERDSEEGMWAVFRGQNLLRFIISGWPKITQQFVGLAVFNTYATYFCKYLLNASLALTRYSSICWQQGPVPRHCHPFLCSTRLDDCHRYAH